MELDSICATRRVSSTGSSTRSTRFSTARCERSAGLWSDAFTPLADIEETDDAFVLEVELPGIDRKDVSVEVRGRWVTISGERTERERKGIFRTKTRVTGRFHYEAVLPEDIDVDRVTATYEDGVLTLHAPKAEPARSKAGKVEIH